ARNSFGYLVIYTLPIADFNNRNCPWKSGYLSCPGHEHPWKFQQNANSMTRRIDLLAIAVDSFGRLRPNFARQS
ncbi:hypothetical protein, partial [Chromobacterium amazonense]|uniref:hypothetical protein n=1 Tax=Chromobacterium amazonense TaxID=1382803 RepID=UPI001CB8CEB3